MKKTPLVLTALSGLAIASALQAQTADVHPPPKVLQISREMIKPGHGAAHAKTEAGWPAAFTRANWPSHYLAIASQTGPGEVWFLSAYDSFAAWEKDGKDVESNTALQAEMDRLSQADGEHLSNITSMVATYREDLSYRAPVNIPQMRYFMLTTYRVKPGRSADFVAARKLVNAVHEKLNMDEHWATYQVVTGAPAGTYLLLLPMKSLADMDAAQEMHGKAYEAAMGEENQKKLGDLMNASLESSNAVLFAFSPKMSYPPKEWTVADSFWAPKVERAAVSAPAKAAAKAPATTPPKKEN